MTDEKRIAGAFGHLSRVIDSAQIAGDKWLDATTMVMGVRGIAAVLREAARSAGGEPCDHNWAYPMSVGDPPTFCKKCGAPKVRLQDMTAAPAPAETTAQQECTFPNCQCPHVEPKRGNLRDCRALEVTHPGPRPVSEPARAGDEDDNLRFDPQHVMRRLNRWQDDESVSPLNVRIILQNAEECIRRLVSRDATAPVPTPPDAAQVPAMKMLCDHKDAWEEQGSLARCRRCGREEDWSVVYSITPHPEGRAGELREWTADQILRQAASLDYIANHAGLSESQQSSLAYAESMLRDFANSRTRPSRGEAVPDDVRRLVIAARKVAFEDTDKEHLRELDLASEAFADRIPWENEDE